MVPTLDPRSDSPSLYHAILFTLVRLRLDPKLQTFVQGFEQLETEWWQVYKKEQTLLNERMAARATVEHVDCALNGISDGVAAIILLETKNNRKSPLFVRYFGNQRPSRFRRFLLGPQLDAMRTWPESLKESKIPALVAYGEALIPQIAAADQALALLSVAEQKITDFRATGQRKQLFDKVNGARKQLYGDVSKMVHDHPEWNVAKDYIDALFEHDTGNGEMSDAELDERINATNAQAAKLMALKEQRAKDAAAKEAAKAEAEKKAKLLAIEAAEKAAADAAAKVAAMKAELGPVA